MHKSGGKLEESQLYFSVTRKSGLTRASAIRSPETAQCDKSPGVRGMGGQDSQFLRNLVQLCVQVGAMSGLACQLLPLFKDGSGSANGSCDSQHRGGLEARVVRNGQHR
jgi:hypothetical protein